MWKKSIAKQDLKQTDSSLSDQCPNLFTLSIITLKNGSVDCLTHALQLFKHSLEFMAARRWLCADKSLPLHLEQRLIEVAA